MTLFDACLVLTFGLIVFIASCVSYEFGQWIGQGRGYHLGEIMGYIAGYRAAREGTTDEKR